MVESMETMELEACLPADLRVPGATITRIAAGLSGAGVYRVEAAGQAFVLKISDPAEALATFRRKLAIRQLASNAGLSPRVVHADETRRAVVSAFVVDRSFAAWFMDPRTRDEALTTLGRTLRRVHDLPLPSDIDANDPRELLAKMGSALTASASPAVPAFVGRAIERVLGESPPPRERATVLSHNDVNPTNLVYDGERLMLLDWETAGANDPFYDLAAIAVFLQMDEPTCRRLLEAHDGAPVANLPARFDYSRRLVAILCGVVFLRIARQSGHAGARGDETLDSTASLGEELRQIRAGSLSPASAEGLGAFGLALAPASAGL
jgi:aminoglycoside phosphotransferase (APT) family kinase protein